MPSAIVPGPITAFLRLSAHVMMCPGAHERRSSLEQVPHGELDLTRRSETFRSSERVEELSEAARRQEVCSRRRGQLKPVDDVVDLDSQLHFLVANDLCVLEKGTRLPVRSEARALYCAQDCRMCRWLDPRT